MHLVRQNPLGGAWELVAKELIPFLELLDEKHPHLHRERSVLLKGWWQLAVKVHGRSMGGLAEELSPERRDRLVESAARHFGLLRKILRASPEHFVGKDSTGEVSDFYHEAFLVLCVFSPPWKRLKPLLLVFSEMTVPAVTSDLRSWPEPDRDPPPHPFSQIPRWIEIAMYPQNLQDQIKKDSSLQGLREEFAAFCLGRLKTKDQETSRLCRCRFPRVSTPLASVLRAGPRRFTRESRRPGASNRILASEQRSGRDRPRLCQESAQEDPASGPQETQPG